ncbi:tyrosine-protein phosphatase [Halochromatium salexigens]|uniref:protein-tyrosine-phosphatase n=1 Tax=Halochromatium salexigens TaxID=49447 RepID=A0AAJ0UEX8_HALSE|nr:CpsB/CapC family capsule biosynthesis tyrosine phosphatase [Halochromatium salexigens]MBK5930066.1 capsular biosynthesis protein [Halochromatium salexigens]
MIDLHCHMLPAIDDGAPELATALEMARIAVADGIEFTACTPHIYPGLYHNDAAGIARATVAFRRALLEADIGLEVSYGADIQMVPEMLAALRAGHFPTLHGSRYFLFEPPHHTVPARFLDSLFDHLAAGFVPVITHPERLSWLDDDHYDWFRAAVRQGAWLQVTAGALTGRFSPRARRLAERLLGDGLVHLLATDAHSVERRPPLLAEGREAAARLVGPEEAERLVRWRPRAVIDDVDPEEVPAPPGVSALDAAAAPAGRAGGWFSRLFLGR